MEMAMKPKPFLTKSKFVAGVQCLKRLYWQVHQPELAAEIDDQVQSIMDQGTAVGIEAQKAFPGGVLAEADYQHTGVALEETARFIADLRVPAVYEATLEHDGVLVRVDILERQPRNRWRLVEVKSSTKLKDHYRYDVAIQRHVASGAGLKIASACLMHLNRDYIYDGKRYKPDKLFLIEDLTAEAKSIAGEVVDLLAVQRRILQKDKPPKVEASAQCTDPVACEFFDQCHAPVPQGHISELPRLTQRKLAALQALGIDMVQDIPESFKLTPVQRRAYDCARSGCPWFGPELSDALSTLKYPLYFMDFETFYPALPRHKGMWPYGHIPFQWSVHVREKPGATLRHHEFLADDATDPRLRFLETLLDVLGTTGSIVVYNQQFESERLKDLARWLPEHAKQIARVQARLWDLLPVVRNNVYHPDFRGSFSIKRTLPALVSGMTYEGMEVAEGSAAGLAWETLVHGQLGKSERTRLRAALLAYCQQDTEAMVRVCDALEPAASQEGKTSGARG
jgi:predicted RecB family nuclease